MNEVKLETERLILRMWREDDFESYAKICADPEVMRYIGGKAFSRRSMATYGLPDRALAAPRVWSLGS